MAKWRRLLDKLLRGSMDIRFDEFVLLLERFGFELDRMRGSHHVFSHPEIAELLSRSSDQKSGIIQDNRAGA
jgi:predicted RNA binding protein YcfA (HicA-like mRNA interferase family)